MLIADPSVKSEISDSNTIFVHKERKLTKNFITRHILFIGLTQLK